MLSRLAAPALLAWSMAACTSAPQPPSASPTPEPPPAVVVRLIAEDGTVVAVNVVVKPGATPATIREIADRQRSEHPAARLILRVFAATAGPERYDLGHVPTGDEPLVTASAPPTLLALYDFPP